MNGKDLKQAFLAFREECIWLRCCYNTYAALYESGPETKEVLSKAAQIFFGDLNRILIEYCWLQMCKVTDPKESNGRKNLTVEYINSLLCDAGLMTEEIACYSMCLLNYRNIIKPGRNRLISHLDKQSVIKGEPIGGHDEKEVTTFLENLQKYVDAVGIAIGVGPLDFRVTSGPGDVTDIISKLKRLVKNEGSIRQRDK